MNTENVKRNRSFNSNFLKMLNDREKQFGTKNMND